MLKQLRLTNFRKHEDKVIDFSSGLQVIRGSNEAGKSTLYSAIGYAFWGSRALEESLDEVVTWGKPVKTLRVELDFLHEGVSFTISRSKSGAELTGPGVTASGQAEVTAFVERLFRASAAVGSATLLASQGSLKDSLDSSSISLIEKLSNMSVIDELIRKIQDKLPCGNTKSLDQLMAGYAVMKEPVADNSTAEAVIVTAEASLNAAKTELADAESKLSEVKSAAEAASTRITGIRQAQKDRDALTARRAGLEPVLVPAAPTQNVQELLQKKAQAQEQAQLATAWQRWQDYKVTAYYGKATDFHAEVLATKVRKEDLSKEIASVARQIGFSEGLLITETACGLCGKDLTDVPEVVTKNATTQAGLSELRDRQTALKAELVVVTEKESQLSNLARVCRDMELQKFKHVELLTDVIPYAMSWTGPAPVLEKDDTDYDKLVAEISSQDSKHKAAVAKNELFQSQLSQIDEQLAKIKIAGIYQSDIDAVADLPVQEAKYREVSQKCYKLSKVLEAAKADLSTAKAVFARDMLAFKDAMAARDTLKDTIAKYHLHNGIIEKLRTARPIIAKKLWNTVLSGVSHYLSLIRGEQSIVTRGDGGFLINGKGLKGYSGSAKDSLGLAIRIMLQKTFLGSIDMMLLDEAASACDDTRESDMLALLSSCGIKQVVLVTHSNLADAFAANVITI